MKALKIITLISSLLFSFLCFAEQETSSTTLSVAPIKEVKLEELNFDELSKETSKVGNLAEYVKSQETPLESFLDGIKKMRKKKHLMLHPYAEGLAYVNGQLCHVGNYPQSIIYTVLEGPHYGLQTTTTPYGAVLYVNYDYTLEHTPYGVILHHFYSDSEVVTGSNQVIIFH